jgi:integrase/recombinase XerD
MARARKPIPGDPGDPHGFPAQIAEFCEWMEIRAYSPNTIKTKRAVLVTLAGWLAERSVTRPAEVTKPMLDGYQRALYHQRKADGKPLEISTQWQRLAVVRTFFDWLVRTNRTLHDPTVGLEMPRREQRLPRAVLSAAEAERVLALPDITTPLGLRDRAMLELLYATGVRRAELSNLAVFDLDPERRALMVRQGKGRKDRMVPTGERAARWCDRYLAEARPALAASPDGGALFLNTRGNKINIERLGLLIGSYVRRSGVGKPGACHLFRHTVATLMLEGGADIRYVQQMLGHSSIESTQLYTRVSLRALESVHAATHPAASDKPRRERGGAEDGRREAGEQKGAAGSEEGGAEERPDP